MSDLTGLEKHKFEQLLGMSSGYVLNFSNRSFAEFIQDSTGRNICDSRYDYGSGSKAVKALRGKGSLLPVGVTGVEGDFAAGDAVVVVGEDGTELAKGLVGYSKKDLEKAKGLKSDRVAELLPQASPEVIHRDHMVLIR